MELEKQMMKNLKDKIRTLEQQLEEKEDEIAVYQSTRSSADEKIQAIIKIHSEKTRSLMTSINLLKKENKKLQDLNNENQRSKLIQQLNKEIGDQDIIIEELRKMVNQEKADNAIIAALNKGPPRLRPESREELKMEIKKLKCQVKKKEDQIKQIEESKNQQKNNMVSQNESQVTEIEQDVNEHLVDKIQELNKEIEKLKIEGISEQGKIKKLESKINEKDKELQDLRQVRLDIQVINKKYEAMQSEYEKMKEKLNQKFMMGYDKEMRLEELELISKQQEGKYKLSQKNAEMEFENLQQALEEADTINKEMIKENEKLIIKNDDLAKANEQHQKKINQLMANVVQLQEEITQLKNTIEEKNSIIIKEKQDSKQKIAEAYSYSASLEERLDDEKQLVKQKEVQIQGLKKHLETMQSELELAKSNMMHLEQHKEDTKHLGPLAEENKYLKQTQKRLRMEQIQLQEQLEELQLQIRLKASTNMRDYPATITAKLREREKEKLSSLGKQIVSLRKHSKELRELYVHLDSNLNSSFAKQSVENFQTDSNYISCEINSQLIDSNISDYEKQKTPSAMDSNIDGINNLSKQQSISSIMKSSTISDQLLIKENNDLRGSIGQLKGSTEKISSQLIQLKSDQAKLLQKEGAFKKNKKQEDNNNLYQSKVTELSKKIADLEEEQFELMHQASLANSSLVSQNISSNVQESIDSNIDNLLE